MTRLRCFVLACLASCTVAGSAQAATLLLTDSTLRLGLTPSAPVLEIGQSIDPVPIVVSSGGGFAVAAGVIAGTDTSVINASLISTLNASATNSTLIQMGGTAQGVVHGTYLAGILGGLLNLSIPLSLGGGTTLTGTTGAAVVQATYGSFWTTGVVSITGVIQTTTGGGQVNTVFLSGSDARTAGHLGTMTLVTPVRLLSNSIGNLPLLTSLQLRFVPEPRALAAFALAAAGLAAFGRRRLRRRD